MWGEFCYNCRSILCLDSNHDIWYNYGVNGIQGITVNGIKYVFRKNVFGDVTHIYKLNEGVLELAAEYKYDAWGKSIVTEVNESGIGAINPIRYRGYYFDTESGLYYLNARYYDPETGRFISADETKFLDPNTVNGLNLYAYCVNNPVMNVDPSGRFFIALLIAVITIGAIIGGVVGGKIAYDRAVKAGYTSAELFGWTLLGAIGGALFGGGVGALVGLAAPAVGAFLSSTFTLGSILIGGSAVAITITGAQILVGVAAVAITVLAAQWVRGSWPGDDPTVPPGDGFVWRGTGEPGSDKGAWYNPITNDSLHPDLNHPKGIAPHWDWVNKVLKIITRIFRG